MNMFFKIVGAIFGFFITFLLVAWLIRLSNGKTEYFGITQVYEYFKNVDLLKPFNEMVEGIQTTFDQLASVTSSTYANEWEALWNGITSVFNLLKLPIDILFGLLKWFLAIIFQVFDFMGYIVSY